MTFDDCLEYFCIEYFPKQDFATENAGLYRMRRFKGLGRFPIDCFSPARA